MNPSSFLKDSTAISEDTKQDKIYDKDGRHRKRLVCVQWDVLGRVDIVGGPSVLRFEGSRVLI